MRIAEVYRIVSEIDSKKWKENELFMCTMYQDWKKTTIKHPHVRSIHAAVCQIAISEDDKAMPRSGQQPVHQSARYGCF